MATVTMPLMLKELTGGARRAEISGTTLGEILRTLDRIHPGLEARVHRNGQFDSNLLLVVDGVVASKGLETPVGPTSEVNILPTFGGG